MHQSLSKILAQNPYSCAFAVERATIDTFKELDDFSDGFKVFSSAVDQTYDYELEQIPESFYEDLRTYIRFIIIQDKETEMYSSGIKFVERLSHIIQVQETIDEAENDEFGQLEMPEDDDQILEILDKPKSHDFGIEYFKHTLIEVSEGTMLNLMMASDIKFVFHKLHLEER